MTKIKVKKHCYYEHNYPPGSVIETDVNYAKHMLDMGDAELATNEDKITPPNPYVMKIRTTPMEDAMMALADKLTSDDKIKVKV